MFAAMAPEQKTVLGDLGAQVAALLGRPSQGSHPSRPAPHITVPAPAVLRERIV